LHRLGIQAFEVKLIEGSAIQLHPLVCAAFNADFDGDQMAVHVPLSAAAQQEARQRMLSTRNLLDPSDGDPVITPTQDIVLGCYYMTLARPGARGEGKVFTSLDEVILAYRTGVVDLQAPIKVRLSANGHEPQLIETTVGRVIVNSEMPPELGYWNEPMDRKVLRRLVAACYRTLGPEATAEMADRIKTIGFHYATQGGLTIGLEDVNIPGDKPEIIGAADAQVDEVEKQYRRGLITDFERHREVVNIWNEARDELTKSVEMNLGATNPLFMMSISGAKGNLNQISQMAGMRGLMLDPGGNIIDLPIRSNFREGLSVLEYFISTHGARKGLADTALRTADSGYLTRRLVDVAQDVIITIEDCETRLGIWLSPNETPDAEQFTARVLGRMAGEPIVDPESGEIILDRNEEVTESVIQQVLERKIPWIYVRTPMDCEAPYGICQMCYGRNLASGQLVDLGEAVGIIAAQSIGEPGAQLTMRTFHTGGVAGEDITTGLPRVEELFEAREPKGNAVIADTAGVVRIVEDEQGRRIVITSEEIVTEEFEVPDQYVVTIGNDEDVVVGQALAAPPEGEPGDPVVSTIEGTAFIEEDRIFVRREDRQSAEYPVPAAAHVRVEDAERVTLGTQLTEGNLDPQEVLETLGGATVQRYIVDEVQRVYKSQGVVTNDKHIEVIVRQMLRKVAVEHPGDTHLLPGELVDRFQLMQINEEIIAEGGEPATAHQVLLGITKASLATDSFLSAASFQETTRVLTEAAIHGKVDHLRGLKENVIIGKLIPAGSGFHANRPQEAQLTPLEMATLSAMRPEEEVEPATIEDVEELVSGGHLPASSSTFPAGQLAGAEDEEEQAQLPSGVTPDADHDTEREDEEEG
jgi:DNA-directed RNA polymerase subunit beta'